MHINSYFTHILHINIYIESINSFGVAKDRGGAAWEAGPVADRAFAQFVSQYDLWNLLTAEIVF